jgi:hypothetical protein
VIRRGRGLAEGAARSDRTGAALNAGRAKSGRPSGGCNGHAATPPIANQNFNEWLKEVMARVVAHLQDEFDNKLAIIRSKHASDIAELQSKRKSKITNAKLAQQERKHKRD